MKVLSLFSGIGAFEKALDLLKVDWELVNFCEFDKYAIKSYCAIHGVDESKNLGDITQVDEKALPKDIDLSTYGFPCQDISLAGKQKGLFNEDGTQTRSGLFFEALRIIEETKPKVAIAENVKNLTSKRFAQQFEIVLRTLEEAGYNNYWKVMNAKDYGVPQNRERVFIVSIRKDIDTGFFKFPEPFELQSRLKDMLDWDVDEKYYLSEKAISYICATGTKNFYYKPEIDLEISRPINSTMHKQHRASVDNYVSDDFVKYGMKTEIENGKPVRLGYFKYPNSDKAHQSNTFYDSEAISPSLDTCTGGNRQVKILVREANKKGYDEACEGDSINLEQPNSKTRRGRVGHGVAQTLNTTCNQAVVEPSIVEHTLNTSRIRKLTPKECFRLMGFYDEDFDKAEKVNSNSQLYKQAGNSIVVDVVYYLLQNLIDAKIL